MPGMDGATFLAELRKDDALRGICVVVLSAWAEQFAGDADVITLVKPARMAELRPLIDAATRRRSPP